MQQLRFVAPIAIGLAGCVSIPQHPHVLEGELGAGGNAVLRDVAGKRCELQIRGSLVSPLVCSDGITARAYLTFTPEGNYVGYAQYSDGSQVALRVSNPHLERPMIKSPSATPGASQARGAYDPAPTYRRPRPSYRTYYRGPRGGCYYINGNGNKTYVDRGLCS